ncbi:MAG: helix-turn-helix transcriptional regulator [Cyclobacteriaceae bacterium]
MLFSPQQFAAARALLGVDQSEISKKTGIKQPKLSGFEKRKTGLSVQNLEKLATYFKDQGIEFLEHNGVRETPRGKLRVLNGYEGFKEFIYDVYETVKEGGNICVTNVDERQFEKWQGVNATDYLSKMASINGLEFRAILKEGDTYFTASYAEYRQQSSNLFGGTPSYIYGQKKAEIIFEEADVTIILIQNNKLADAGRKVFEALWGVSEPV